MTRFYKFFGRDSVILWAAAMVGLMKPTVQFRLALQGRGAPTSCLADQPLGRRFCDAARGTPIEPPPPNGRDGSGGACASKTPAGAGRPRAPRLNTPMRARRGPCRMPATPPLSPTPRPPPSSPQHRSAPVGPDAVGSAVLVKGRRTHLVFFSADPSAQRLRSTLFCEIAEPHAAKGPLLRRADGHRDWIHPYWRCSWIVLHLLHPTRGFLILDEKQRYRRLWCAFRSL